MFIACVPTPGKRMMVNPTAHVEVFKKALAAMEFPDVAVEFNSEADRC